MYQGSRCCRYTRIGHLLETAPPDAYGDHLKNWTLDTLPILPQQWKVIVKTKTSSQFKVVTRLLKEATELVIASDAHRVLRLSRTHPAALVVSVE